ncbi:hypothetical protein HanRHA438_Chr02g0054561 [Helianthus annuus]|nr:hypothetical protein HanRHA438_Chr02g0054561 [Helianthus annuus]
MDLIREVRMNSKLQCSNSLGSGSFLTEGIGYHISLTRMVLDRTVVVIQEFNLTTLLNVELLFVENMLKTYVVGVDDTLSTIQVVSPDFEGKNYGSQLQIVGSVVLFVNLELTRCVGYYLHALH